MATNTAVSRCMFVVPVRSTGMYIGWPPRATTTCRLSGDGGLICPCIPVCSRSSAVQCSAVVVVVDNYIAGGSWPRLASPRRGRVCGTTDWPTGDVVVRGSFFCVV